MRYWARLSIEKQDAGIGFTHRWLYGGGLNHLSIFMKQIQQSFLLFWKFSAVLLFISTFHKYLQFLTDFQGDTSFLTIKSLVAQLIILATKLFYMQCLRDNTNSLYRLKKYIQIRIYSYIKWLMLY